jgi:hypothetical protein
VTQPPVWYRRLRFWGPDVDADVDDELRFHLESCAADLAARGHPPEEARRLALARFGDVGGVRRTPRSARRTSCASRSTGSLLCCWRSRAWSWVTRSCLTVATSPKRARAARSAAIGARPRDS